MEGLQNLVSNCGGCRVDEMSFVTQVGNNATEAVCALPAVPVH
jgi:hypothetical protein